MGFCEFQRYSFTSGFQVFFGFHSFFLWFCFPKRKKIFQSKFTTTFFFMFSLCLSLCLCLSLSLSISVSLSLSLSLSVSVCLSLSLSFFLSLSLSLFLFLSLSLSCSSAGPRQCRVDWGVPLDLAVLTEMWKQAPI